VIAQQIHLQIKNGPTNSPSNGPSNSPSISPSNSPTDSPSDSPSNGSTKTHRVTLLQVYKIFTKFIKKKNT